VNIALGPSATGQQDPDPLTGARTLNIIQFNLVVDELVLEQGITLASPDLFTFFSNNFGTEYSDNIHPNGVGYESMAEIWADVL